VTETPGKTLAERLITAAQEAVYNEPRRYDEVGLQYTHDARAALVATLRELADRAHSYEPALTLHMYQRHELRALAKQIEEAGGHGG